MKTMFESQFMAITPNILVYLGPIGTFSQRKVGARAIYISLEKPFGIRQTNGSWENSMMAIIPSFVSHDLISEGYMASIMVEQESVYFPSAATESDMIDLHRALLGNAPGINSLDLAVEFIVENISRKLVFRPLDSRIEEIVSQIQSSPWQKYSAEACSNGANLSLSRFLHLFKEETGFSFRQYLAWKRSRYVLARLKDGVNLTSIALDAGYADSSHFSHTIKQTYGLHPREMFSRCSNLTLQVV